MFDVAGAFENATGGWNTQPQSQHLSQGQGAQGAAQVDNPQAQVAAALQSGASGGGGASPSGNGQGGTPAQPQQSQPRNEFLEGILSEIDPAHRPIVEPYLGKWNAGVTRRFQDLHGQLQPFTELGADPDTLAQALSLMEMVDANPQQVMAILQEAMDEMAGGQGQQQQLPQGVPGQQAPGQEGQSTLPPEFQQLQERFGTFETVLEAMAQQIMDQRSSEQTSQEDAQLDQYLGLLKQEFGDYDEHYVIAKMMAGVDGAEAVKQYQAAIQGQVNNRSRQPNVPPVLGGGSSIPQGGKSVTDATKKETKNLVAQILAASQQS